MEIATRVSITDEACRVIDKLRTTYGDLMFHQSDGCCDGSQPMCFPLGEFKTGDSDVLLASVHNCPFYMSKDQFQYWKHTHLTMDVVAGRGSSFSIEIPLGLRFIIHSRLFTESELLTLQSLSDLI